MQSLPIDAAIPGLLEALRSHHAVVLVAPPGAGKTTRVPPAIVREDLLSAENPNLIMLQPRRVAARASAQRIAEEQSWTLGTQVGYHVRFEKRYQSSTRIRVLTEAILTRMLTADPSLEGIGCVILDEFHERNLHTDLALAFLREIQQTIRPDLKIVVMSATLDAQPVATFLGDCPIVESEGRAYPVEISYRPLRDSRLEDHIKSLVNEMLSAEMGDILVFLPGLGEIERVRRALGSREGLAILPLHGGLTSEEQQMALRPDPQGRRKIVLATNVAETSLTIDGVRIVIDSGLARVASFDADRGMDRLDLERISKASATQRAGRAGRQVPGRAIRLWSHAEQNHLSDFTAPEIHRVDLAATLLAVHAWGAKDPRTFAWFDPPEDEMLAAAEILLSRLGVLRAGVLTDAGGHMLRIPTHPRIARILLSAIATPLLEDALNLAALLSDDSRAAGASDPLSQLHRLPPHLHRVRDQLAMIAQNIPSIEDRKLNAETLSDLLLLAFPDRIARRRGADPYAAIMTGNIGVRLVPDALTPALAQAQLFLVLDPHHDPKNKKSEATVRTAIPVSRGTLERLFPQEFRVETALEYDDEKQKVVAFTRDYFGDLLLEEDPHGKVDPHRAGEILAAALRDKASELFGANEAAARLLARVALLRHHMPEHHWPTFDDAQLRELLTHAAAGKRALAEITSTSALSDALHSVLIYPLDRLLDQYAPESIEVPSGSHIKVDYSRPVSGAAPSPPILAVRLQELFGLLDTPRLAGGRAPVLLHLLSPGYKPIQITSDLRSFWSSAYFEVRKDLRTRYPKHKWPDDPLSAAPEAKGRRRG